MYIFSGITDRISEFCMGAYHVWGGGNKTHAPDNLIPIEK